MFCREPARLLAVRRWLSGRPPIQRASGDTARGKKIHFVVLVFSYQPKPLVELLEILAIV
jgi:hypothetical protein